MRCIFCKAESSDSKSIEHIIPESLGNDTHVLPPGVVCDNCNNYFAREVEKPFLDSIAMRLLRFHQAVENKRGLIPPAQGILAPKFPVTIRRFSNGEIKGLVEIPPEAIDHLFECDKGAIIIPASSGPPSDLMVSRFLAKVAVEAMAQRLLPYPETLEYLVDEAQLDPVRNYARSGRIQNWPVHIRRIYEEDKKWLDESGKAVQVVHEYDILKTDSDEWYLILALFGTEFALNIGGPEIEGYLAWLTEHDNVSPLYWGKNAIDRRIKPAG
ncbi:MAG: HNH endonuclease [Sedimentisphaerales bacterium]